MVDGASEREIRALRQQVADLQEPEEIVRLSEPFVGLELRKALAEVLGA